jgi:elongation factor G
MAVDLVTPEGYLGAVIGEVNARRGQVRQLQAQHGEQRIQALVPLAQMFGFTGALRSLSQGRASSSMQLSGYAPVPVGLHRQVLRQAS